MGKQFGNLMWATGITYYTLSPNELRPFAGMLNPGVFNAVRRFRENVFIIGVPVMMAVSLYTWATNEHHRLSRKNPDHFKDDV